MPGEYRAVWNVPGGGTGYSVFHSGPLSIDVGRQAFVDAVRAFFAACQSLIPNDVTITFESEFLVLSDAGVLQEVMTVNAPNTLPGGSSSAWAAAAGGRVDWLTGEIVAGRRFFGRTYLVPLSVAAYDTDGTILATERTKLQNAANGLIAATTSASNVPDLAVWSRAHSVTHSVTSANVADKTAILRSRRE